MKYPGTKYSHPITFDKTKVVSDVTGGSWILTRANFHPDMLTTGGTRAAKSDGGDLRFFTDSSLDTEIPADIIKFTQNSNPANAEVEIVVKCNLSSSVNTVIYVGWGDPSLSLPDRTSTFGRNNAYDSAWKIWCPMYDGTSSTVIDRTVNDNNGTKYAANKPAETTGGQVNRYQAFGNNDSGITFPAVAHGSAHTVFWNFKTSSTGAFFWQNNQSSGGYRLELPSSTDRYWIVAGTLDGCVCFTTAYNNNTWRAFAWKIASSAHYGFVNGTRYDPLGSITAPSSGTGDIRVGWRNLGGGNEYSNSFDLDFFAIFVGTLADDTIKTMQNNHSNPGTFATYGSITEYSTGAKLPVFVNYYTRMNNRGL